MIAHEERYLDLDPIYKDRFGNPLLRLTFEWKDNERNMWRFIAQRAQEIMTAMNPSRVVQFTPEIPEYNIHDYQSTHPTGGCIMGTDPSNSVTNTYGQVWDTPNVLVTGAALFPQNPGAIHGYRGRCDVPHRRRPARSLLRRAARTHDLTWRRCSRTASRRFPWRPSRWPAAPTQRGHGRSPGVAAHCRRCASSRRHRPPARC